MGGNEKDAKDGKSRHVAYALCQLTLSLNGKGINTLYNACGDSGEFAATLTDLAEHFDAAWDRLSPDEHEEAGHDYIEEIDTYADWIVKHARDIVDNSIEYPYFPGKAEWSILKTVCGPDGRQVSSERIPVPGCASRKDAEDGLREIAVKEISKFVGSCDCGWLDNLAWSRTCVCVGSLRTGNGGNTLKYAWRLECSENGGEWKVAVS